MGGSWKTNISQCTMQKSQYKIFHDNTIKLEERFFIYLQQFSTNWHSFENPEKYVQVDIFVRYIRAGAW